MAVVWLHIAILIFIGNVSASLCTRYDDKSGTCYVDRRQKWISSHGNISCNSNYPNCIITCFGDPYSCGSDQDTTFPYIICGVNGNECTINCNSNEACYGSIIYSTNYSLVNININGMDQSMMQIYAPHHGSLHINLLSPSTSFTNNKIYSSSSTISIYIDCQHGISCNKNTIDAQPLLSSLIYKCDSYCDSTQILCPIHQDADCHIECKNSCNNMLLYSADMNQLQFICDYIQCKNTLIQCLMNNTLYESQVIPNYNGIGSLVGACTDSISSVISKTEHIEFSADLNVYIYYNQSTVSTVIRDTHFFTELMHDAVLETYDIISVNDEKHENISGHIINITFCVMYNERISNQCGELDIVNNVHFESSQHRSEFVAFGLFNIVSTDVDMMLFKQYVIDIISSDIFMTYFNQNMNVKLFSTDAFESISINIDDNIIAINTNTNTKGAISAVSSHRTSSYPGYMMIVFVIIGICGGTLCSLLCGYSVHKWCNSEFLLTKLESNLQETEKHKNDKKDKKEIKRKTISMDTIDEENISKLRAIHWGFTNDSKYGELTKEISSSPSIKQNREYSISKGVHRKSYTSSHRVSIDSMPEELQRIKHDDIALKDDTIHDADAVVTTYGIVSDDGNLYEDDNYNFEHKRSQTLNMERALKQNAFQHKYKRMRHFKSMKSISSVEIEDLFSSPTISHVEGPKIRKGHTIAASYDDMCNYDPFHARDGSDHVYASTMPAFSLLHPIEISQFDDVIEQMDDDLDDYNENHHSETDSNNSDNSDHNELRSINQSSSPKQEQMHRNSHLSVSCTPSPNDCSSDESLLDDFATPTITPLLQPQIIGKEKLMDNKSDDKLSKLSDDTEPELPLSPSHSVAIPIPSIGNEIQRMRNQTVVINITDTDDSVKYGSNETSSLSSTKL